MAQPATAIATTSPPEVAAAAAAAPLISLSYPGWEEDQQTAERLVMDFSVNESDLYREKISAMRTKQQLYDGDRSDPNIVALDSTEFTYTDWELDKAEAERRLQGDCTTLQLGTYNSFYYKMIKKQALMKDRSSVPLLQALDDLALTYPGFQADKKLAEQYYTEFQTPVRFHQKVEAMKCKEQLHRGDRSHPDLVALDQATFTYPQWQEDVEEYMQRHVGDCSLFQFGITCDFLRSKMHKKQQLHANRSSIDFMEILDQHEFSYGGWQADKQQAELYYVDFSSPDRFLDKVQAMQNKQRLLVDGDRSHPDLVALDSLVFTYKGWQADREEAEKRHIGDCTVLQIGGFESCLTKMKKRQAHHEYTLQLSGSPACNTPLIDLVLPGRLGRHRNGNGNQPLCFSKSPAKVVPALNPIDHKKSPFHLIKRRRKSALFALKTNRVMLLYPVGTCVYVRDAYQI